MPLPPSPERRPDIPNLLNHDPGLISSYKKPSIVPGASVNVEYEYRSPDLL
jgi:hypothetical protein